MPSNFFDTGWKVANLTDTKQALEKIGIKDDSVLKTVGSIPNLD
jgi:hypothetical protein